MSQEFEYQEQIYGDNNEYIDYNAIAKCGKIFSFGDKKLFAQYAQDRINEHSKTCKACKVLFGKSKAKVMTQEECARLFDKGIDMKKSHNGNLHSDNGILWHYRTIEAIRTRKGKIIGNNQCWSSGFASCPRHHEDYNLPISTIQTFSGDYRYIHIKDRDRDNTLFEINTPEKERNFLFGIDENDHTRYLVELKKPCNTVREALEQLKPQLIKDTQFNYKRQGDLFFMETGLKNMDLLIGDKIMFETKQYFEKETHLEYEAGFYGQKDHETMRIIKKLVRCKIIFVGQETRHEATQLIKTEKEHIYVKGYVYHPQHRKIKLDTWHLVLKNNAKNSWQVSLRGGGGGFD